MTISLPATTTVSSTTTSLLTKSIHFKSMDLESNQTLTANDLDPNPDLSTRRSQTLPNSGYTVIPEFLFQGLLGSSFGGNMDGLQADEPQNDLAQYADFMKGSKNRPRPPKSTLAPLQVTTTRSTSIRTTVTTAMTTTSTSIATTLRSTSIFNEHMKDVPGSLTSNDPLTSWSDDDIPKTELPMHLVLKPIKATQPPRPKNPLKTGVNKDAGKYIPTNQVIGMALE